MNKGGEVLLRWRMIETLVLGSRSTQQLIRVDSTLVLLRMDGLFRDEFWEGEGTCESPRPLVSLAFVEWQIRMKRT